MTETFIETPASATRDRAEILAAIILGIAASLAAFAAYMGALADGDSLQGYTESSTLLTETAAIYEQGNIVRTSDQSLFVEYASASLAEDTERADYLLSLMSPNLQEAVEWWESGDEARSPFDAVPGNPYVVPEYAAASDLEARARASFVDGVAADERSDVFELAAVFFALALFFGGIGTLFTRRGAAAALLTMSVVALAVGSAVVVVGLTR